MNVPINIALVVIGALCGLIGVGAGILWSDFVRPASGILTPFFLLSLAVLIVSVAYAASILLDFRERNRSR